MIKKGSQGSDVESWQLFLRGLKHNSKVIVNGIFDDVTDAETRIFQTENKLLSDGIVGPATLQASYKYEYPEAHERSIDYQNPGIQNLSFIERQKLFGYFSYEPAPTPDNPEAIRIKDAWSVTNIKSVYVPQLAGVAGASKSGIVQVHTKIADQFVGLFQAWEDAGLKDRILTWGGSWVPRFIRGSRSSLSNHSWGTAFDINAQWNGLGVKPADVGKKGSVKELVSIAVDHGFYWGGWFPRRPDGMHFEAYKII
jgi:hypothetical protein